VLWQKERLLNVALRSLPLDCEAVAWLDCDIVFGDPGSAQRARDAVERFGLVHLLHERHNLPPDAPIDRLESWDAPATSLSAVRKLEIGSATVDDLVDNTAQLTLGRFELVRRCQPMTNRRFAHDLGWARPYHEAVGGRRATIPGRIFHLWHSELKDRHYGWRMDLLRDFHPFADIAVDRGGSWRWSSPTPELHAAVRAYFDLRLEDGAVARGR